jgi:hypothetical protein
MGTTDLLIVLGTSLIALINWWWARRNTTPMAA